MTKLKAFRELIEINKMLDEYCKCFCNSEIFMALEFVITGVDL